MPSPRRKSASHELVYFVRADNGAIKIGKSVEVRRRLETLKTSSSARLELLGTCPNENDLEHRLHDQFKHLHLFGEWFRADCDLLVWIDKHADTEKHEYRTRYGDLDDHTVDAAKMVKCCVRWKQGELDITRARAMEIVAELIGVPIGWITRLDRDRIASVSASDFMATKLAFLALAKRQVDDIEIELERVRGRVSERTRKEAEAGLTQARRALGKEPSQ